MDIRAGGAEMRRGSVAIFVRQRLLLVGLGGLLLAGPSAPASAQLMALPGKLDVNDTGALTYSIPIDVPPGTSGMQPALSLEYNSRAGNGLFGVGWSIAGLPAITRCPQTAAQDGAVKGINYDANDRFCLDGQRLVAITGTYGADLTEYRTEREGFSRIVSYGTAGTGPAWFKAWTKSGQIMEFGNTADSRVEAVGKTTARLWSVNRIQDTKANYISVTYTESTADGYIYPARIDYTGNAGAGVTPYASVRLSYVTSRPDVANLYVAGSIVQTVARATNIRTYIGETLIRDYQLTYEQSPADNRSRLTSVKLCDPGAVCLPATTFAYENGGFASGVNLSFTGTVNPMASNTIYKGSIEFGDWNGDGITDAMWIERTGNSGSSYPAGTNRWYISNLQANGTVAFTTYSNPIATSQLSGGDAVYLADVNGDGKTDLVWWDKNNGNNRWFISNGVSGGTLSFTQYTNPIATGDVDNGTTLAFGDWNGDGRTDVMWWDIGPGSNNWFINNGIVGGNLNFTKTTNPITPAVIDDGGIYFGDWNGDGITDFLWYNYSGGANSWYVSNGAPGGTLGFTLYANPIATGNINGGMGISFGDWNGDGLTDVMWWDKSGGNNRWFTNKGVSGGALGFKTFTNTVPMTYFDGTGANNNIYFGDWNGDGLTDVVHRDHSTGNTYWFTTRWGSGETLSFVRYDNPIAPANIDGGTIVFAGDWNGDGITDLLWRDRDSTTNGSYWAVNNAKRPDVMVSVSNGLGQTTTVSYDPLTKGGTLYTKDTNAVFPVVDLIGPIGVVKRVDAGNGIGGTYSSTYRYAGAKADATGRGFLGFRTMTVRDEQTTIEQTTTNRQDWPYLGLASSKVKALGATELNRVDNTYAADNLGGIRRFVKLGQSVETSKELNGAAMPTVTTTYTYDGYGNATQIVVSTGDGYTKTTANTYTNDTTNWLLGRLTRATVTSVTP